VPPTRDHAVTAAFLHREFGAIKFANTDYLSWFYDLSPEGVAVCGTRDDVHGRLATYSLVPQWWRNGSERVRLGITVDACVRAGAQRSGVFTQLATEVFEESASLVVEGTLTIANANSTPAFVDKLGLVALGPLPVRAVAAAGASRGVDRLDVDDASLAALAADCAARTTIGWVHDWNEEALRWRLASPVGAYALHRDERAWCVSTRSSVGGVPVAVILALIPRRGQRGVNARAVVTKACRHHRAVVAIHAGRNADVVVRGLPVPRRFLPSPLNLLARGFGARATDTLIDVATYEFLDTDHY
jgi:hypothetical protein